MNDPYKSKREFFDGGNTRSYAFRIGQLKLLKTAIKKYEDAIIQALYMDLHKPEYEAYTSEIAILYEEINFTLKHLKKWMKVERVATPLVLFKSKSKIYKDPLGVVLIIGPWNYPFQLLIAPLIGAIAGGNCAVIKPSDQAKQVSKVVSKLISEYFSEFFISVVQGPGAMLGPQLIEKYPFNHIFFTGSPNVGKMIMSMSAKHLCPVTLELGGKSPVIVDKTANLEIAAKRLVWAKFFNAGQTCVCPDYLLIEDEIKDVFIEKLKIYIDEYYGVDAEKSADFGRIINEKRFDILKSFLDVSKVIYGGKCQRESKYIAPSLVQIEDLDSDIMQEEIFGPILPIISFKEKSEIIEIVRKHRYPLALYLFSESKLMKSYLIDSLEFGGACINNGILHLANSNLPFGGVGNSGMGAYHGKYSFEVFTRRKSVLETSTNISLNLMFPPYSEKALNFVKRFMK